MGQAADRDATHRTMPSMRLMGCSVSGGDSARD